MGPTPPHPPEDRCARITPASRGTSTMQVLVVDPPGSGLPDETVGVLRQSGWDITPAADYGQALELARTGSVDAVLISEPANTSNNNELPSSFNNLLRTIETQGLAAVMVSDKPDSRPGNPKTLIERVHRDVSPGELRGRFAMIERYQAHFKQVEQELRNMERLGKQLNQHFLEVDQEMRLAGRLQRDFLPQLQKPIGNVRFASLFRPASWVSGDIFDVFRIDEQHTGFYVADAVGHGMAASLLTMFIKQALVPKRVEGESYAVLTPSETLAHLNDALAEQELPNCQFITACYGLLDHRTWTFQYARAGHPYPILFTSDGAVSELKSGGGLLGLFQGAEFPTGETQLHPGDKLLLYTDGMELAFQEESKGLDSTAYRRTFDAFANLPIDEMIRSIEAALEQDTGSLSPQDDVTIVGAEILETPTNRTPC